jgi:AcrR family transcriptional regulator
MSRASSRRAVQAAETKRVILDAALRLFTAQGYGATSVGQIAEEAGVAVPTVYASAGTKPALLRQLLDRMDEQAGIPGLVAELVASDDALHVLTLSIGLIRQLAERCGDIIAAVRSAAGVEPEMAELFAAGLARHRAGAELTVGRLVDLCRLRPDVPPERATAILATLSSPATYSSLAGDYGWSFDQCEAWLQDLLRHQLLAPPGPAARALDESATDSPADRPPLIG